MCALKVNEHFNAVMYYRNIVNMLPCTVHKITFYGMKICLFDLTINSISFEFVTSQTASTSVINLEHNYNQIVLSSFHSSGWEPSLQSGVVPVHPWFTDTTDTAAILT